LRDRFFGAEVEKSGIGKTVIQLSVISYQLSVINQSKIQIIQNSIYFGTDISSGKNYAGSREKKFDSLISSL
jgi:hypothetical protein